MLMIAPTSGGKKSTGRMRVVYWVEVDINGKTIHNEFIDRGKAEADRDRLIAEGHDAKLIEVTLQRLGIARPLGLAIAATIAIMILLMPSHTAQAYQIDLEDYYNQLKYDMEYNRDTQTDYIQTSVDMIFDAALRQEAQAELTDACESFVSQTLRAADHLTAARSLLDDGMDAAAAVELGLADDRLYGTPHSCATHLDRIFEIYEQDMMHERPKFDLPELKCFNERRNSGGSTVDVRKPVFTHSADSCRFFLSI